MAYTTVNKSSANFKSVKYQGTGNDNLAVTGVGFSSDFTWTKKIETTTNERPYLFDTIRGATKYLNTSHTNAEQTATNSLKAWTSDGYTAGTNNAVNQSSSYSYTTMNWKANGSGSANTDGSINSTVSANTTSGFSIVKYTATGSNATVGHGLSSVPKMIIIKDLEDSGGSNWGVYHNSIGNTDFLELNNTAAKDTSSGLWNNTTPTSSVFSIGNNSRVNNSGNDFIAYCFADVQGYQKCSSYISNGNSDGVFQYLGFRPSVILTKNTSQATDWIMHSNDRNGYNGGNTPIFPSGETGAGNATDNEIDFLSNGFKVRNAGSKSNGDGAGKTLIYLAIGQSIVGTNNVPCTAR